jgi:hypothetical protein
VFRDGGAGQFTVMNSRLEDAVRRGYRDEADAIWLERRRFQPDDHSRPRSLQRENESTHVRHRLLLLRAKREQDESMAGFDDITKKAQEFLNDDKVKEALKSEKAEEISDKVLDGVADTVKKVTGGKFDEQVEGARKSADKAVGTD